MSSQNPIDPLSSLSSSTESVRKMQEAIQAQACVQEESAEDLLDLLSTISFNRRKMMEEFQTLEERLLQETEVVSAEEGVVSTPQEVEEAAIRVQKSNPELRARTLLILRARLGLNDSPEELLRKVLDVYSDPALADEALEFLIRTASPAGKKALEDARADLLATREREIAAGRNMGAQAREFSKEGLGSPTTLRDLYRDLTGNPREPIKLFEELSQLYAYGKLKPIISFLLHSMGQDLKSKGPSVPPDELMRLMGEIRSLQGILGVYRFFQTQMRRLRNQAKEYGENPPAQLTFEEMAKGFIRLVAERYIVKDKVLQLARQLGISTLLATQILVFSLMRDALKQIAPRYYRTAQHRDELFQAFMEAIEELEEDDEEEGEDKE